MIPNKLAPQLIKEAHERYGHSGAMEVHQMLKLDCQLSHMFRTIKQITQSCDICQKSKIYNQTTRGPLNLLKVPREMLSLDLIGPLPQGGEIYIGYTRYFLKVFPSIKVVDSRPLATLIRRYNRRRAHTPHLPAAVVAALSVIIPYHSVSGRVPN